MNKKNQKQKKKQINLITISNKLDKITEDKFSQFFQDETINIYEKSKKVVDFVLKHIL